MRIIAVGKTKQDFVILGIDEYAKRLNTYLSLKWEILPDSKLTKNMQPEHVKEKEGEFILNSINKEDFVFVLDENGKLFTSIQFADSLQSIISHKKPVFVIGGVYGLSHKVLQRADTIISFSRFTFTHQMIRLLLIEQIYRAFTIIREKKYHN
jgi:23S rRNA (pseudouridine1915-N3)-methyltransferase